MTDDDVCPTCLGTGEVEAGFFAGAECPTCGGTGLLETP